MSTTAIQVSPVTSTDRLGLTLVVAVILHAILILGVSFNIFSSDKQRDRSRSLEVTMVHSSDQAPDKADYLAQANQQGGGQNTKPSRPSSPVSTPLVSSKLQPHRPQTLPTSPPPETRNQPVKKIITAIDSEHKLASRNTKKSRRDTPEHKSNAKQLISRSMAMASLSAEIDELKKAYAKLPNQKRVAINARQYKYASYVEAWRRKVENIGNLNYPQEAVRRKLTGSLEMEVIINADGTINNILILRSSSHKVLDDAAVRIVKMASPYAPFPKNIRNETRVLSITRTWQFLQGNRLYSK